MSQARFLEIAHYVTNLKMYPYFDAANYIVMCLMVRDDSHVQEQPAGSTAFSRKHPLASWLLSMLMCFAGSIWSNVLVGEGAVVPFKQQKDILLATAVWYVINYCPFDLVYKVCKLPPFRILIYSMKQIQAVDKVHHGVTYAVKKFPGSYMVPCVIGVAKGAGYNFMRTFERLVVRGAWNQTTNEILQPSFSTKACLAASFIFVCHHFGIRYLTAPFSVIYLSVVVFFVYFSVAAQLSAASDPFLPFERLFCAVFFGGLSDAIASRLGPRRDGAEAAKTPDDDDGGAAAAPGGDGKRKDD